MCFRLSDFFADLVAVSFAAVARNHFADESCKEELERIPEVYSSIFNTCSSRCRYLDRKSYGLFIFAWFYWKPIFVCGEYTYYTMIYVKILLNITYYHVYHPRIHLYRFLNSIIFKLFFIRSDFNCTFIQPYSGCSWNLLYNFMDHDSWNLRFTFNVFPWIILVWWGYVYLLL